MGDSKMKQNWVRPNFTFSTIRTRCVSVVAAVSCFGLIPASDAFASTVEFGGLTGFAWTSPMIETNGTAHAVNTAGGQVMRLTDNVGSEAGSAFIINPYVIGHNTDFTSNFVFQITSPGNPSSNQSDGLAFVIGGSPTALGATGGGLGYGGSPALTHSVIVEFDTYSNALFTDPNDLGSQPNNSHVALMTNGDPTNHLISRPTSVPMDNGDQWEARINYYGQTDYLSVYLHDLDQPGIKAFFDYNIDIANTLGCGSGGCVNSYLGFTAATGGGFANHDIVSWGLTVPEPGSLSLFAVSGLVALCLYARGARRSRVDS